MKYFTNTDNRRNTTIIAMEENTMKNRNGIMRKVFAISMVMMLMLSAMTITSFAASKYGEDKPLKSKKKFTQYSSFAGHNHQYIDASNGCRYLVYHSCMNGLIGTTPTNHSAYVTIDGVKYSLCNYSKKVGGTQYASVIKKVGTTNTTTKTKGTTKQSTAKVVKTTNTTKSKTTSKKTTQVNTAKHINVNDAYTLCNKFRTTRSNQWYWNSNNKTKTYTYGLKALKKDATLEKIAKVRAQEQWTRYYSQGKCDHTRPNGKDCWTAYTKGSNPCGENLAWGYSSSASVINGWAETNEKYSGQGHRRNMLAKYATRVGIACYEKDGKRCWAMCLGY